MRGRREACREGLAESSSRSLMNLSEVFVVAILATGIAFGLGRAIGSLLEEPR